MTTDSHIVTAIKARWIVPVTSPPIEHGVMTALAGRICFLGPSKNWHGPTPVDWGDVVVLPALVNAHTHLEFSHLQEPVGQPGMKFPDWIPPVVQARRQRSEQQTAASISQGLAESWQVGIGSIGEISTAQQPVDSYVRATPNGTIFHEVLSWDRSQVVNQITQLQARLSTTKSPWQVGLSPHAPYTVCKELLNALVELAVAKQLPVAMHVAESFEELQLLATGQGSMRQMLEQAQVWRDDFWEQPRTVLSILRELSLARRSLIIHGNYLNQREQEFLAQQRDRMTVVYCPRTHRYFQHEQYPLQLMLQRGVAVAIGTDSRASNPDLSLWAELQLVANQHHLQPAKVLELGTINGAKALGLEHELGSLAVGKLARCAVLGPGILAQTESQLEEQLFAGNSFITGRLV